MYISSISGNYGLPRNSAYHFSAFEARWLSSKKTAVEGAQSCGRGFDFVHSVASGFSEILERVAVRGGLVNLKGSEQPSTVYEGFEPFLSDQRLSRSYSSDWAQGPMVSAFDLIHRRWENIPEELVFFRQGRISKVRFFPEIDTTGFGAGVSLGKAIDSGFLELVEKNCLVLMWLSRKVFAEILVRDAMSEKLLQLDAVAAGFGLRPRFFDISFIPGLKTVFAVALTSLEFPFFSVGAASARCELEACENAFNECLQLFISYSEMLFLSDFEISEDFGSHAAAYLSRNSRSGFESDFSFLDGTVAARPLQIDLDAKGPERSVFAESLLFSQLSRLFFVPFKSSAFPNHVVCRVISPDLLWTMIPKSLDLPLNRKLLLNLYPDILKTEVKEMLVFP